MTEANAGGATKSAPDTTYHSYAGTTLERWTLDNLGIGIRSDGMQRATTKSGAPLTHQNDVVLDGESRRFGSSPLLRGEDHRARCGVPESQFSVGPEAEAEASRAECGNGTTLPVKTVVFANGICEDAHNVLREDKSFVTYDFRWSNPINCANRPSRSKRIQQHLNGFDVSVRSATLVPQVARRLGRSAQHSQPSFARLAFLRVLSVLITCRVNVLAR